MCLFSFVTACAGSSEAWRPPQTNHGSCRLLVACMYSSQYSSQIIIARSSEILSFILKISNFPC